MKRSLPIFLLLFSLGSHAELNKWVDANGKVHYSDEPPPENAKVQTMRLPHSQEAPASAPPARKSIFEQEADVKKEQKAKEEAAQKAAKEQEAAQTKQRNCDQARAQLATLQNSPRITTYDANGERTIMDDNARQQAISDTQTLVGKYCN
jgi:hypothetical protein